MAVIEQSLYSFDSRIPNFIALYLKESRLIPRIFAPALDSYSFYAMPAK